MADEVSLIPILEKGLKADAAELQKCDLYYEGKQPLKYMSEAMKEEMGNKLGDTVAELVINWARYVADAYENRLDVEGFRYPGAEKRDDGMWAAWQANDMDEQSQQAHLDSIVLRRSYVTVGSQPEDSNIEHPLITVESPFQMWARRDPRTRKVTEAIKSWKDLDEVEHRLIYTTESIVEVAAGKDGWTNVFKTEHSFKRAPVVPLVNHPRIMFPDGVSEFADILPLADAANKMATDMMISGEYHAMPRRWVFGLSRKDFEDQNGNPLSTWSQIKSRIWASEEKGVTAGQFNESSLTNFHDTIKLLAQMTAQLAGLPPHYLAFTGDNPASADAIRASEAQLVKRIERKHTYLGGSWEDVHRLVKLTRGEELTEDDYGIETIWRDPATPTLAQKTDAVVKLHQATDEQGRSLLPAEMAYEELNWSPGKIARALKLREQAIVPAEDPQLDRVNRSFRDVTGATA